MKRPTQRLMQMMSSVLMLTLSACGGGDPAPGSATAPTPVPGAAVVIPLALFKNTEIQTVPAGPADIRETLTLYGRVAPNAERVREVRARFAGIVRSVTKAQGDHVNAGAMLATVESDESLQTYAVTAPIAGIITVRRANSGERSDSEPLFIITDVSSLWVELSVFPRDRARIHAGQPVHVRAADGGLEADARLTRIDVVGGANQAVTARATLDNSKGTWAPGLYVVADVVVNQSPAAVTIPRSAVQHVENRETAFVRTAVGYEPRTLKLGRKDADKIEVLEGIAAGESVVHTNTYLLASELVKPEPEQ